MTGECGRRSLVFLSFVLVSRPFPLSFSELGVGVSFAESFWCGGPMPLMIAHGPWIFVSHNLYTRSKWKTTPSLSPASLTTFACADCFACPATRLVPRRAGHTYTNSRRPVPSHHRHHPATAHTTGPSISPKDRNENKTQIKTSLEVAPTQRPLLPPPRPPPSAAAVWPASARPPLQEPLPLVLLLPGWRGTPPPSPRLSASPRPCPRP